MIYGLAKQQQHGVEQGLKLLGLHQLKYLLTDIGMVNNYYDRY